MNDLDLDTILTPPNDEKKENPAEEIVSRAVLTGEVVYPEMQTGNSEMRSASSAQEPADSVHSLALDLEQARRQLQRSTADFENFKRRVRREHQDTVRYANENILRDLLPVLDNLERASDTSAADSVDGTSLRDGLRMVVQQVHALLDKYGVRRVVARDQVFNPAWHEAMRREESRGRPPGTIVDVLQHGYTLDDRLLRPSRVVVAVLPELDRTAQTAARDTAANDYLDGHFIDLDSFADEIDLGEDNGENTEPTADIPILTED